MEYLNEMLLKPGACRWLFKSVQLVVTQGKAKLCLVRLQDLCLTTLSPPALTDRQSLGHSIWVYSVRPAHVDLGTETYPAIKRRAKKHRLT